MAKQGSGFRDQVLSREYLFPGQQVYLYNSASARPQVAFAVSSSPSIPINSRVSLAVLKQAFDREREPALVWAGHYWHRESERRVRLRDDSFWDFYPADPLTILADVLKELDTMRGDVAKLVRNEKTK